MNKVYDWLKLAYPKGWATEEQCKLAVVLKKITPEQYKDITKKEYVV